MQKIKEMMNNQLNKNWLYYLKAFVILTCLSFLFAHPISGFLGGLFLGLSGYAVNTLAILSLSLFAVSLFKIQNNVIKLIATFVLSLIITFLPLAKDVFNFIKNPTKMAVYTTQKTDFEVRDMYMTTGNIENLPKFLQSVKSNPFLIDIKYSGDEGCMCSYWRNNTDSIYMHIGYEKQFKDEKDFKDEVKVRNINNDKFLTLEANAENNILNVKIKLNGELLGEYSTYFMYKERTQAMDIDESLSVEFFSRYAKEFLRSNVFAAIDSKIFDMANLNGLHNMDYFIHQILDVKNIGNNQRLEIAQERQMEMAKKELIGTWTPQNKNDTYAFINYTFNSDGTFIVDKDYKGEWSIVKGSNFPEYPNNLFKLKLKSPNFGGERIMEVHMSNDYHILSFLTKLQANDVEFKEINYIKQ